MSFPNIPEVSPAIELCREEIINLLLASVAFEELGLAHIINAEAEKLQFILGTLEADDNNSRHHSHQRPTLDDLLKINKSVERTLRTVVKNQMLLQFKLEDIMDIPEEKPCNDEEDNDDCQNHYHKSIKKE